MKLHIAPYSQITWQTYSAWFTERGIASPSPPKQMVLVANEYDELIFGACIYSYDGPWLHVEYLSTRPGVQPKEMAAALRLGFEAAKAIGATVGKPPVILEQNAEVADILLRAGYTKPPLSVWIAIPGSKESPRDAEEEQDIPEVLDGDNGGTTKTTVDSKPRKRKTVGICEVCGRSFIRENEEKRCATCVETAGKVVKSRKPRKKTAARRKKSAEIVDKGPSSGDE